MDLHLADRRESGIIQSRVSRICNEQIIPALIKICDDLSPEQGRLLVDKLELDIGVITADNLEQELTERLYTKLKEEIKKLKLASMFDPDVSIPESVIQTGAEEDARSRVDLLIHFFRNGTVPWWNPYSNKDIDLWIKHQFEEDKQALISAIGAEIGTFAFRSRVVRYFSDHHFQYFFRHFKLDDLFQIYLALKNEIQQKNKTYSVTASWEQLRHPFLETLFEQLLKHNLDSKPKDKAAIQFMTSIQKKRALVNTIHSLERSHTLDPNIITRAIRSWPEARSIISTEEWDKLYNQTDSSRTKKRKNQTSGKPAVSDQADSNTDQETFILVHNAGMVLLWTNFNKLFTTLGYVNNKAFIDEHAIHRAIHLLHFISTGQQAGEEHEWALNKILCGLPPGSFVPYEIDLTDEETAEAEEMTKASIENWRALKSTSIKGFRDTFLLRDGILSQDVNGWRLQIERLSYDILLDKLPWPISVINLPWTNHLVHVQW